MGAKPSKQTPKDQRLKKNNPAAGKPKSGPRIKGNPFAKKSK